MNDSNFVVERKTDINQIRVESCICTILAIKEKVQNLMNVDPIFMFQFNKLEAIIPQIKKDNVTEKDVERIEDATNHLLDQVRLFFANKHEMEVYEGLKH